MPRAAAHLLDPRGGVHGVTEHDDLAFQIAHLAHDQSAGMDRSTQARLGVESAKIGAAPAGERILDGEEASDAVCVPYAARPAAR